MNTPRSLSDSYLRKLATAAKVAGKRTPAVQRATDRANRLMQAWRGQRTTPRWARGVVLYEGLSRFNGEEIVAIATSLEWPSQNTKTGDMLGIYILLRDIHPGVAVKDGQDDAVCGTCRHRPSTGGDCYVETAWGPAAVWRSYQAGRYPYGKPAMLRGALVRIGTYGDPAALPLELWEGIAQEARGHTGYTHFWRDLRPDRWGRILMASVDTDEEEREAQAEGWRTYRVLTAQERPLEGSRACPAPETGLPCSVCLGCDGTGRGAHRAGFHINKHGPRTRPCGTRQQRFPF